jgi:hypothetical protein
MPLTPLTIPAGVYRHGTDLEGQNRWRDVNLIRWRSGSMQPIGGWQERTKTGASITDAPRGAIAWVDNSSNSNIAVGTASKLFYISSGNGVTDITPTGFTAGNEDATVNVGYGGNYYGTSLYGVSRPYSGVFQECTTWSLDTWGEYLVGCSTDDGKLYEWQLNTASPAAVITNAPTNCTGLVVTGERFLFALAAGGNPRKIQWSDKENNTVWSPLATNEAGDIELQTNGEILSGHRLRGRTLILTTTDAHIATYIGPQLVFGFERVGESCGAISRKACVANQEGAFWMGNNGFFAFNGSAVQEMPCEVLDYVFSDLNRAQQSKIFAVHNSQFGEAWWFYPSSGSNINDRYVIFDYKEGHWSIGKLDRSAGFDAGVFGNPIWFDSDGKMYDHETNYSYSGYIPYAETGPIILTNEIVKVNEVIPDEKTQGSVLIQFKSRFYPNGDEYTYGPYDPTNPTSVRFSGRQFRMRIFNRATITPFMPLRLTQASLGLSPLVELFSVVINSRLLGDINNDGRLSSADGARYQEYMNGIASDEVVAYIENVFHPYIYDNMVEYAVVLDVTYNDWRFGIPRLNVINGGRR